MSTVFTLGRFLQVLLLTGAVLQLAPALALSPARFSHCILLDFNKGQADLLDRSKISLARSFVNINALQDFRVHALAFEAKG